MNILGISAFYHDSAVCLITDGVIRFAAQEERFSRKKHDAAFPHLALAACMAECDLTEDNIDYVVFYDKPFIKFDRILETYCAAAPYGVRSFISSIPMWINKKLWVKDLIRSHFPVSTPILFAEHHRSHAASAFYPSPFDEAAILTIDGVGEWATASYGIGKGNEISLLAELRFPHSLGLLYSAFTYFTGFKVNSGEYKLMGLAPYGEDRYVDTILSELIDIKDDGSLKLNQKYFNYAAGLTMTNRAFARLFDGPPRKPETKITQREMDLARSVQIVTEEIVLRMTRHIHTQTQKKYLCLAGGVALNCVANGRVLREGPFEDIWLQPAAGDAGGALGCALLAWYSYLDKPRVTKADPAYFQGASLLGPSFSDDEIRDYLTRENIPFTELTDNDLPARTADLLASEKVVGWFQGKMEFGPRALGNRSILGDPRSTEMQSIMNVKIKFRESFRPFAPSVLAEHAADYFQLDKESPYMLLVAPINDAHKKDISGDRASAQGFDKLKITRSDIPAVTHVDYSARVQTVQRKDHPLYWELINTFYQKTGCPLVINTSFNVRGEPIVCTPQDAYRCFMRTDMDYLVMGHFLLDKNQQPSQPHNDDWKKEYELD